MKLIIDGTAFKHYPFGRKDGFRGGSENYVAILAEGLAQKHEVHVVAADIQREERRGPNEWWWPEAYHPTEADAVLCAHNLEPVQPGSPYHAPLVVWLSNGLGANLGPDDEWAQMIDGVACFSKCHADFLGVQHPRVARDKCYVTGLGVDLSLYDPKRPKVPGRMFFSNDPARGLWHALDVFDAVKKNVPDATLHVGYDFDRQFAVRRWKSSWQSEQLWECEKRLKGTPGVVNLGSLTPEETRDQIHECHVHVMPSEPSNVGSQIHGLLQAEHMATGTPCVLSDIEAFGEVFGAAASILPIPGAYIDQLERRYDAQDWGEAVTRLMRDNKKWHAASKKSVRLARTMVWPNVVKNVDAMLGDLWAKFQTGQKTA